MPIEDKPSPLVFFQVHLSIPRRPLRQFDQTKGEDLEPRWHFHTRQLSSPAGTLAEDRQCGDSTEEAFLGNLGVAENALTPLLEWVAARDCKNPHHLCCKMPLPLHL